MDDETAAHRKAIGEITTKIEEATEKWEKATTPTDKAFYDKSIDALNGRLDRLVITLNDLLIINARALAADPAPGKNPPLALNASVPPLHANTPNPSLVVASLSSSTIRNKPRFKPRVELEAACSYEACPSVVRGRLSCMLV